MASKKVLTQVKKAVQLVEKEHWPVDQAALACHVSIVEEITLEELEEMIDEELGGMYA